MCVPSVLISTANIFFRCRSLVHSTLFALNFPFIHRVSLSSKPRYTYAIFGRNEKPNETPTKNVHIKPENKRDECKSHTTKLSH